MGKNKKNLKIWFTISIILIFNFFSLESYATTKSYDPNRVEELKNSDNTKLVLLDPKNTNQYVEGEYAFVPQYLKDKTRIKISIGTETTEVVKQKSVTFSENDVKAGVSLTYENVGTYQGAIIDLVQEVISVSDKVTIGLGGDTGLLYSNFLGVSATGSKNSDKAKLKYTFKYHDTQEDANINFYLTFIDIDREESLLLSDTRIQNVYLRSDSPIVGDIQGENELYMQSPKRNSWWDNDWNVDSSDETRWVSITLNKTSTFTLEVTTSTSKIDESTVTYASESLVPLQYPSPYKNAINTEENKDNNTIQYSIFSYIPGKVIPVPEPKYQISDSLPEQFQVQDITVIDAETGQNIDFDISIDGSNFLIDGKKLLSKENFYGRTYIFTVTGIYQGGDLSSFEQLPNNEEYVNIPNIAHMVVANIDETDRILKTNEANAPFRLPKINMMVNYLDEEGNEISPGKLIEGPAGTSYEENPIEIPGYKYKKLSENSAPATGIFSDSLKNIEFVYEKLIPVKNVTVKYVNTLGEKLDETTLSGNIGEEFKTEQKEFPGYKFKKVDGPTTGKFTDKPQTIIYTYATDCLRFYNVPSELIFNESEISTRTKTISRKNASWKMVVEDTRLNKGEWRVTAKLSEQFKDSSNIFLKNNILIFSQANHPEQWITTENEINVFNGNSSEEQELYDVSWQENAGPLIQVAPGTVKVGKYTGVIKWNLIDAPV